jgi:2'-5' RNA ligase
MNQIKKDYAYVALLDPKTSQVIKEIQSRLKKVCGNSEYEGQWPPHTTISFGNLLSSNELVEVKKNFNNIAQSHKPFNIYFEKISIIKKVVQKNKYYYITFKIKKNKYLDALSREVMKVAQKHDIPFDKFTKYRFHVTIGKYAVSDLSKRKLLEIIGNKNTIQKAMISSFSIFYSTFNNPRPKNATEVDRFDFNF